MTLSTCSSGRILDPDIPVLVRWCYDPASPTVITARLMRYGRKEISLRFGTHTITARWVRQFREVPTWGIDRAVFAYALAGTAATEFQRLGEQVALHTHLGVIVAQAKPADDLLQQIEAAEGVEALIARLQAGAL